MRLLSPSLKRPYEIHLQSHKQMSSYLNHTHTQTFTSAERKNVNVFTYIFVYGGGKPKVTI